MLHLWYGHILLLPAKGYAKRASTLRQAGPMKNALNTKTLCNDEVDGMADLTVSTRRTHALRTSSSVGWRSGTICRDHRPGSCLELSSSRRTPGCQSGRVLSRFSTLFRRCIVRSLATSIRRALASPSHSRQGGIPSITTASRHPFSFTCDIFAAEEGGGEQGRAKADC